MTVDSGPRETRGWRELAWRGARGATVFGLVLLALWQAGALFRPATEDAGGAETGEATGEATIDVRPADVAIETPNQAGLEVGPEVGSLAPDFEVTDLRGDRIRLSDFRGRPILLNFWATWCGPCRQEMPDIQAVLGEFGDRELAVIALNYGEPYDRARRFIRDLGLDLTVVGFDPTLDVARRYAVGGMPTSFFINGDGVVTRVYIGQVGRKSMASAVLDAIESAVPP